MFPLVLRYGGFLFPYHSHPCAAGACCLAKIRITLANQNPHMHVPQVPEVPQVPIDVPEVPEVPMTPKVVWHVHVLLMFTFP